MKDRLHLRVRQVSPPFDIKVFDTKGRLVFHAPGNRQQGDKTYVVDLSGQPPGIYYLRLQTKRAALTRKVIIAE